MTVNEVEYELLCVLCVLSWTVNIMTHFSDCTCRFFFPLYTYTKGRDDGNEIKYRTTLIMCPGPHCCVPTCTTTNGDEDGMIQRSEGKPLGHRWMLPSWDLRGLVLWIEWTELEWRNGLPCWDDLLASDLGLSRLGLGMIRWTEFKWC